MVRIEKLHEGDEETGQPGPTDPNPEPEPIPEEIQPPPQ